LHKEYLAENSRARGHWCTIESKHFLDEWVMIPPGTYALYSARLCAKGQATNCDGNLVYQFYYFVFPMYITTRKSAQIIINQNPHYIATVVPPYFEYKYQETENTL
jgi:hypothetical protein